MKTQTFNVLIAASLFFVSAILPAVPARAGDVVDTASLPSWSAKIAFR